MRIIAGQWRGRRLTAPAGEAVRPTTDRTKEALFSILGPAVNGRLVLDLCCGAGGLGLEALSRGARRVIFVDSAPTALAATRANLSACGAQGMDFELIRADALTWLERWPGAAGEPWLLLCDPPYSSEAAAAMMSRVVENRVPAGLAVAVVEHGDRTPGVAELASVWEARRYGESHLAIFRPGGSRPAEEQES